MLNVGLIGLGFMGRTHLENYIRLEAENFPVRLAAICDVDRGKFQGEIPGGNIGTESGSFDLSKYNLYTDMDEMLKKEQLDYVDITLPTYLHAEAAIKALQAGFHVLCEKPMALRSDDCAKMIEASGKSRKKLMIAQCLRFWPAYEYLKECVGEEKYGKVTSGYFFRGGATPVWSYKNWLLKEELSGGCLLDQHIHDVDMINWLFGKPQKVTSVGRKAIPGSGFDMVSTNYIYDDDKVINAQDDWTLNGDYSFRMLFRVNFEKANLVFEEGVLKVNPNGEKGFIPELSKDMGYYRELKYFVNSIINDAAIETCTPESTRETIQIAEAEMLSALRKGEVVRVVK